MGNPKVDFLSLDLEGFELVSQLKYTKIPFIFKDSF